MQVRPDKKLRQRERPQACLYWQPLHSWLEMQKSVRCRTGQKPRKKVVVINKVKKAKKGNEKSKESEPHSGTPYCQTTFPDNQLGLKPSKESLQDEKTPDPKGAEAGPVQAGMGAKQGEPMVPVAGDSLEETLKDAETIHVPESPQQNPVGGEQNPVGGQLPAQDSWYSWHDSKGHSWGWAGWGWGGCQDQWWHPEPCATPVRKREWTEQEWEDWKQTQVGWEKGTPSTVASTPTTAARSETTETLSSETESAAKPHFFDGPNLSRGEVAGCGRDKHGCRQATESKPDVKSTDVSEAAGKCEQPAKEQAAQHPQTEGGAQGDLLEKLQKEKDALQDSLKATSEALPATATEAEKDDQEKRQRSVAKEAGRGCEVYEILPSCAQSGSQARVSRFIATSVICDPKVRRHRGRSDRWLQRQSTDT